MGTVEKLSIALTSEFAADIRRAVASGEFVSTSEVIRDALRAWKLAREKRTIAIEELRRLWENGLASGESRPLDAQDIKRRGRERLASLRAASR